jgi:hypothetical protein
MNLKEPMKSDNNVNKFFIIQMITLNIIVISLIIKELITLNNLRNAEQFINSNQSTQSSISEANLEILNSKYQSFKSIISSQNTLGDLINFVENKSEQYNLKIIESKVIYATENEINYEITLEGTVSNIANFVSDVEEDKSVKEINNSSMKFVNNIPNVKISIINKKL